MVSTIVLALFVLAVQERVSAPVAGNVEAVRALYGSGEYEEALRLLSGPEFTGESTGEVEQYRALCLLALGRVDQATGALEELVRRMPLFKMSESDVSPRLLTMFHEARKRLLPAAAKDLYAKAKANFERQSYSTASTQFGELALVLADPDLVTTDAEGVSDLKMLGDGFRKLADLEVASAAAKAAAARAAAAALAPAGPLPVRIYSDADKDVKPPVEVMRTLPEWRPVASAESKIRHTGVLRIVIDEAGKVETATLVAPIYASYDPVLIEAARKWQFKPAIRDGQPVKFQKLINITLSSLR
jgi:TonB family protein